MLLALVPTHAVGQQPPLPPHYQPTPILPLLLLLLILLLIWLCYKGIQAYAEARNALFPPWRAALQAALQAGLGVGLGVGLLLLTMILLFIFGSLLDSLAQKYLWIALTLAGLGAVAFLGPLLAYLGYLIYGICRELTRLFRKDSQPAVVLPEYALYPYQLFSKWFGPSKARSLIRLICIGLIAFIVIESLAFGFLFYHSIE
jgi:hypothetical protein